MKKEIESTEITTTDLRKSLKVMMQVELLNLPTTIKDLAPAERLNILCKLLPYVLPKVETVSHEQGEKGEFEIGIWK